MTTLKVSVRPGGPSARPGESLIVAIGGELDIATVPRFTDRFDEILRDGLRRIVVDVSKLTFVDVTGLRALSTLRTQAEQRRIDVRLSGVSPHMRRLMSIFGPTRDFPASDRKPEFAEEEGVKPGPRRAPLTGRPRAGYRAG